MKKDNKRECIVCVKKECKGCSIGKPSIFEEELELVKKKHLTDQEIVEFPKGKFGSPFGILNKREKIIKKHLS